MPGSDPEAEQKAVAAFRQLGSDTPVEAVISSTGLEPQTLLPDELLPLTKLSDYLGPKLTQQIPALEHGEYSRPVEAEGSIHILHLLESQGVELPPFEQARPAVEAEFLRRTGDDALRQYLAWLRKRTEIVVVAEEKQ